jgi:hypothetical protein
MSNTDLPVPPDEIPEDQPVADTDAVVKVDEDRNRRAATHPPESVRQGPSVSAHHAGTQLGILPRHGLDEDFVEPRVPVPEQAVDAHARFLQLRGRVNMVSDVGSCRVTSPRLA